MDDVAEPREVWVEGEKIPEGRLKDIFRSPPGAPPKFVRSSLIIGARGVGKTVLLRHHKETHRGIAASVALAVELASITKQTGHGPLASDYSEDTERLISSKATSLLAVSIAERLARKGVTVEAVVINPCLPRGRRIGQGQLDLGTLTALREQLAEAPVDEFVGIDLRRALPESVRTLAGVSEASHGPLLLLLDKADMVPTPALIPVLELLDQSPEFIVLVAIRPGHGGHTMSRQEDVTEGDHYQVIHLGTDPRGVEWRKFVEAAVEAQLGPSYFTIPLAVREKVITLTRDSVRNALEVFARYLSVPDGQATAELEAALEDYRENQLHAAQSTLLRFHPSFRGLVRQLRDEALEKRVTIDGPIQLSVAHPDLFGAPSAFNNFVEMALRTGAVATRPGTRWMPGVTLSPIEIPPILTWEKGDAPWPSLDPEPIVLVRTESQALSTGGGGTQVPRVFVAYRFRVKESEQFRNDLATAMGRHRTLSKVLLEDGKVAHGELWAPTVRKRIGHSKLVIGDVTGMTREVLFELGFAYGLGKSRLPVVADAEALEKVPRWLTATQIATFGDLSRFLGSVETQLASPRPQRPKQAIQSLAYWIRPLDWSKHEMAQATTAAGRIGLTVETPSDHEPPDRLIQRAATASLLIASFDGTEADSIIHFVCGAIMAKPTVTKLQRQIILLEQPGTSRESWVADSLRRCTETVVQVPLGNIADAVHDFAKRYYKWSTSKPDPE